MKAVILRNHGLICFGRDFAETLGIAEIVEESLHGLCERPGGQRWAGADPGPGGAHP